MKGFAAGFAAVWILLLSEQWLPDFKPADREKRASYFVATPTREVSEPVMASLAHKGACERLLASLFAQTQLSFDHRSEQVKSDALYLVDAVTETLALCSGLALKIELNHFGSEDRHATKLTRKRAKFLQDRWAANGVQATISETFLDDPGDDATRPAEISLQLRE